VPVRLLPAPPPEPSSYPPLIARLLRNRGIPEREAPRYFHPAPSDLTPPSCWPSGARAARALADGVLAGRAFHLHGDYDVDGLTSTALLAACLKRAGATVTWTIPHRSRDGYGLGARAVEAAREAGAGVLLALDCGTNDAGILASALEAGMAVVVLDHHIPHAALPPGVVLANPHGVDCPAPFKDLPTAGIAFEVALETAALLGRPEDPVSLARVACLGIVQDVAPLTGENRAIVKLGMEALPAARSLFLRGLLDAAGVGGGPVRSHHIGYRIGPRLNAPGRMDDATFIVDLLLGRDEAAVAKGLERIEAFNRQRQDEQERTMAEAEAQIDGGDPVLLASGDAWPLGVVGLVAGRLSQKHGKPALVFSRADGLARGSGRSVPGLSLVETLQPHAALFRSFGGHDSACGITVELGRWEEAERAIRSAFAAVPPAGPAPIEVDAETTFAELEDEAVLRCLESMEPFGPGNPRPVLLARGAEPAGDPAPIYRRSEPGSPGGDARRPCGVRLMLRQGNRTLKASLFGDDLPGVPPRGSPLFTVDQWRGRPQLELLGFLEEA
jgi:single-stranded-DNA-specific exonuclease